MGRTTVIANVSSKFHKRSGHATHNKSLEPTRSMYRLDCCAQPVSGGGSAENTSVVA